MFNKIMLTLITILFSITAYFSHSIYSFIIEANNKPNTLTAYYRCGGSKKKPVFCPITVQEEF